MEKKSGKVNLMSPPTRLHPHILAMDNTCRLISLTYANKYFYGLKEVELRQIVRIAQIGAASCLGSDPRVGPANYLATGDARGPSPLGPDMKSPLLLELLRQPVFSVFCTTFRADISDPTTSSSY